MMRSSSNLTEVLLFLAVLAPFPCSTTLATKQRQSSYMSVLGDSGMKASSSTCVTWSGWNFCNGARQPEEFDDVINPPSPRMADCVIDGVQRISAQDNALGPPSPLPDGSLPSNPNFYARKKEVYLAQKCAHPNRDIINNNNLVPFNFSGWHVMFKSGIMDDRQMICPCSSLPPHRCFHMYKGPGKMNQPYMVHRSIQNDIPGDESDSGYFAGTYDVNPNWNEDQLSVLSKSLKEHVQDWIEYSKYERAGQRPSHEPIPPLLLSNSSFLFTAWYRVPDPESGQNATKLSFFQGLKTSRNYPWLMNYLRCNQVQNDGGGYGGYPWDGGFGILRQPVGTYGSQGAARMLVTLRVLSSSPEAKNQFYLPELGGCWKLDGSSCSGTGLSVDWPKQDVTRYICFIALASLPLHDGCGPSPEKQKKCPPYHILSPKKNESAPPNAGIKVFRNDTKRFPYHCYFLHCYSGNDATAPVGETCDPWSNPNPQELMQLLPCEEWGIHGFPTEPLLEGHDSQWNLDVGGLGARLFLQGQEPPLVENDQDTKDNPLPPGYVWYPGWNRRTWLSLEIGPEQMDGQGHFVRWVVEDWDVQIPTAASMKEQ